MTAHRQTEEPQAATWSHKLVAGTSRSGARVFSAVVILAVLGFGTSIVPRDAGEPARGSTKSVELGGGVTLELVCVPPGEFIMGSTPELRAWATGIEGGATPGTSREQPEGDPRPVRIKHGFWMGRPVAGEPLN